jgi:hypothetical protein
LCGFLSGKGNTTGAAIHARQNSQEASDPVVKITTTVNTYFAFTVVR